MCKLIAGKTNKGSVVAYLLLLSPTRYKLRLSWISGNELNKSIIPDQSNSYHIDNTLLWKACKNISDQYMWYALSVSLSPLMHLYPVSVEFSYQEYVYSP